MRYPVNMINLKQKFGSHKGLDLGWNDQVGKNQPVMAIDDGEVIYNRHQVTGGYVIHIKHNNGYVSEYGHLLKDSQKVREGHKVKKGQVIALMGKSGIATGPHLHLGLYKGNYINYKDKSKFVDPFPYLCRYEDQWVDEKNSKVKSKDIHHTKKVKGTDGELNIRNKPGTSGKIVGTAKEGSQVESFGVTKGWNIVDNIRGYYCSNNYLK